MVGLGKWRLLRLQIWPSFWASVFKFQRGSLGGRDIANPNNMHKLIGNPSKLPNICINFVPPKKRVPFNDPCQKVPVNLEGLFGSSSTKAPWYVNGIQFLMRCWLDAKVGKHVTQIVSTCWQSILRKNQSWVNFTHDVNRKHCKFTKFHQPLK